MNIMHGADPGDAIWAPGCHESCQVCTWKVRVNHIRLLALDEMWELHQIPKIHPMICLQIDDRNLSTEKVIDQGSIIGHVAPQAGQHDVNAGGSKMGKKSQEVELGSPCAQRVD